ncbi:MAG: hypothetical protein WDW36_008678 [Sanguina aurantia]
MPLGILYALVAGLMWGMVFVAPLVLPDYPAALLSVGRYIAFGLIALMLAWFDRAGLRRLSRSDWLEALKLALVGNLLYYLCLASAIQRIGAPVPTMIIGTLPVVIAVCANRRNARRDGSLRWTQLLPSLLLIAAGIGCVNHAELATLRQQANIDGGNYLLGVVLAIAAVACWTWYPLRNADWLRANPGRQPRVWSTAQGVAVLPLALIGYALLWVLTRLHLSCCLLPQTSRATHATPDVWTGMWRCSPNTSPRPPHTIVCRMLHLLRRGDRAAVAVACR